MQQRPANLPLSLALAGRGFIMGVCLGLSGVVMDPIKGEDAYCVWVSQSSFIICTFPSSFGRYW